MDKIHEMKCSYLLAAAAAITDLVNYSNYVTKLKKDEEALPPHKWLEDQRRKTLQ